MGTGHSISAVLYLLPNREVRKRGVITPSQWGIDRKCPPWYHTDMRERNQAKLALGCGATIFLGALAFVVAYYGVIVYVIQHFVRKFW